MTKTQAISAMILAKIAEGLDSIAAMKAVLGAEAVDRFIGELYDELRAKAVR